MIVSEVVPADLDRRIRQTFAAQERERKRQQEDEAARQAVVEGAHRESWARYLAEGVRQLPSGLERYVYREMPQTDAARGILLKIPGLIPIQVRLESLWIPGRPCQLPNPIMGYQVEHRHQFPNTEAGLNDCLCTARVEFLEQRGVRGADIVKMMESAESAESAENSARAAEPEARSDVPVPEVRFGRTGVRF